MRFTFDGHGINDTDEYASRLATLTLNAKRVDYNVGELLAAAPELLEAAKPAYLALYNMAMEKGNTAEGNSLLCYASVLALAIEKAEGK